MTEKFEGLLYLGDTVQPQLTESANLNDEKAGVFELLEAG